MERPLLLGFRSGGLLSCALSDSQYCRADKATLGVIVSMSRSQRKTPSSACPQTARVDFDFLFFFVYHIPCKHEHTLSCSRASELKSANQAYVLLVIRSL